MKKVFLVIVAMALATSIVRAEIKEVKEKYEETRDVGSGKKEIWKGEKVKTIEFTNEKGKKVNEIKISKPLKKGNITKSIEYLTSPNKDFVIITNRESKGLTKEEYRKTGYYYKNTNKIIYYDKKGKDIFILNNVEYEPVAISKDGKAIVCVIDVIQPDDLPDNPVSPEISKNPPKDKVFVLSRDGKVILEKEERYLYVINYEDRNNLRQEIMISSNGTWLFYRTLEGYKLINISNGKEIIIPSENIKGNSEIMDDGTLLIKEYQGQDNSGKRKFIKKKYYPDKNIFEEIGVEYND